jgi:hypothetical protein
VFEQLIAKHPDNVGNYQIVLSACARHRKHFASNIFAFTLGLPLKR